VGNAAGWVEVPQKLDLYARPFFLLLKEVFIGMSVSSDNSDKDFG